MRLNEWVDKNGNKISNNKSTVSTSSNLYSGSGYKKRFDKLIEYYSEHLPKGIDYIEVTLLTKDTLAFTEYYNNGTESKITVYIGAATEAWNLKCRIDGKLYNDISGIGWSELLKLLNNFITVPVVGTPEYKDLLVEWVDSNGNKININNTSSQPASSNNNSPNNWQKYRYERLLAQIDADGIAKYKLNKLTNDTLDITVDTKLKNDLNIKIIYFPEDDDYSLVTNNKTTLDGCDYEEDLLPLFQAAMIIRDTDLCESLNESYSLAEDFKTYENLWD